MYPKLQNCTICLQITLFSYEKFTEKNIATYFICNKTIRFFFIYLKNTKSQPELYFKVCAWKETGGARRENPGAF